MGKTDASKIRIEKLLSCIMPEYGEKEEENGKNSLVCTRNGKNWQGDNSLNIIELNTVGMILAIVTSYCVTICAPEQAIAYSTVTNEEDSSEEHKTADSTGLALQEESNQIKCHEHNVGL